MVDTALESPDSIRFVIEILGTIVVPMVSKIDIDSIDFLNKKFYVNLQMKYYSYVWYPQWYPKFKEQKV